MIQFLISYALQLMMISDEVGKTRMFVQVMQGGVIGRLTARYSESSLLLLSIGVSSLVGLAQVHTKTRFRISEKQLRFSSIKLFTQPAQDFLFFFLSVFACFLFLFFNFILYFLPSSFIFEFLQLI